MNIATATTAIHLALLLVTTNINITNFDAAAINLTFSTSLTTITATTINISTTLLHLL